MMRLNWTIKLHVHNHYCGNSCGKIGELSLDVTCQPLGMFEMTIFLLQLHFNAHLLWNPQCGYMHLNDDKLLMIAIYGSFDEGFWSAFNEIDNSQPRCLDTSLSFYLFIFVYIVYIFISIFHYMSMWFGLPCYPWQSVLLQKSACKWWENVY